MFWSYHPPDPEDKTLFKVMGRVDDQIMLSTGEKVMEVSFHLTSNPLH